MAKVNLSAKQLQIDKANTTVTIAVAVAVFVLIFSLIASKTLLDRRAYQSRVIKQKEVAVQQLKENIEAVEELEIAYAEFVGRQENIIGGVADGNSDRDGDNAKITLDALPSKYDFPALATSIEKLVTQNNSKIIAILGDDAELEQAGSQESPEPYEMPFSVTVEGAYEPMYNLINIFERSIRPIQIQSLRFEAGSSGTVQMTLSGITYYMPEKNLNIITRAVE